MNKENSVGDSFRQAQGDGSAEDHSALERSLRFLNNMKPRLLNLIERMQDAFFPNDIFFEGRQERVIEYKRIIDKALTKLENEAVNGHITHQVYNDKLNYMLFKMGMVVGRHSDSMHRCIAYYRWEISHDETNIANQKMEMDDVIAGVQKLTGPEERLPDSVRVHVDELYWIVGDSYVERLQNDVTTKNEIIARAYKGLSILNGVAQELSDIRYALELPDTLEVIARQGYQSGITPANHL